MLFAEEGTLVERVDDVGAMFSDNDEIMEIVEFMRADSPRGLTQPR
jgi:UDP-N-acetylglucosamine acyltransferase